ncbi:hypothetical protein FQN54_004501 [Arachnomyces sp. PD_36]|nr:hypothetical protein FQN54_004501 [Arachnomyces sp. PD_36]
MLKFFFGSLFATAAHTIDLQMPKCKNVEIEEASISDLQEHLTSGQFAAVDLAECYLKRIEAVNPYTRSVIEINPDALSIAAGLDSERCDGKVRGPLHGIPFLVKDNMATKDKMQTTAGSSMLIGSTVPGDAHVVSALREAGAVLLGHANLADSEGYSSRGGQSRNPYNLSEQPGGSSSGSAEAVACNMCAFSLGTETDASVISPADRNGVVGIKATVGLISRHGIIPESESLDTVGPFGKTVKDAAVVLDAIVGKDSRDNSTASQQTAPGGSYLGWVSNKDALKGARFGLPSRRIWDAARTKSEVRLEYDTLMKVINRLEEAGAEIIEGADFPSAEEIISPDGWDWDFGSRIGHPEQSEYTVVKTDFYNNIKEYLSTLSCNPNKIRSLEDIVAFNNKYTTTEGGIPGTHPAWVTGQDSFDMSLATKGVKDETYYKALDFIRCKSREEGIDAALSHGGVELDGLLVPIHADGGAAGQVAAKAVGIGDDGVPFSLGIIQTAWKEHLLVKFGSAIEDLVGGRRVPTFLNLEAKNYMYVGVAPGANDRIEEK